MQRILIIQTAFIGDVVLMLPIAQRLKQAHPEAEIHVLVRKGNESLVAHHPDIARVWVWNKRDHKYRNWLRTCRMLMGHRFDLIVNVQRFASTGLMTWLLRGRYKACFRSNPLSFACSHRLDHVMGRTNGQAAPHEVDRNLSLIAAWAPTDREPPRLYPTDEEQATVLPYRSKGPYVVVAPASVWFTKQLPRTKWAELVRQLSAQYHVYLVGSADEAPLCEELAMLHIHAESLAGKLSLLESAALMQGAKRVFCNDSAPMHLASAVNAPTTAIFCSTVPDFGFGPLSDVSSIAEPVEELSCRPCGLHGKSACPQKHFKCGYTQDVHAILGEFRK